MTWLPLIALGGLLGFFAGYGWAAFLEAVNPATGCTCSRHRWDPACPVHGRDS
jgi:hypothetical protein